MHPCFAYHNGECSFDQSPTDSSRTALGPSNDYNILTVPLQRLDLQYRNVKVEVVSTKASTTFFDAQAIRDAGTRVWRDEDEWNVSIAFLAVKRRY